LALNTDPKNILLNGVLLIQQKRTPIPDAEFDESKLGMTILTLSLPLWPLLAVVIVTVLLWYIGEHGLKLRPSTVVGLPVLAGGVQVVSVLLVFGVTEQPYTIRAEAISFIAAAVFLGLVTVFGAAIRQRQYDHVVAGTVTAIAAFSLSLVNWPGFEGVILFIMFAYLGIGLILGYLTANQSAG
jgi:hypothetical protein